MAKSDKYDLIKGKTPESGECIMTDTLAKVNNRKKELKQSWKGIGKTTPLHVVPSESGHKFKKTGGGPWTNYNSPKTPLSVKKGKKS